MNVKILFYKFKKFCLNLGSKPKLLMNSFMLKKILTSIFAMAVMLPIFAADITAEHRKRATELVNKMTLEEKLSYIHGDQDGFTLRPIERLGIPRIYMADGPQGIRNFCEHSTLYPCGILLSATWNPDMANRYGKQLGSDARARGVDILLAPGVNIYRSPLCGRNFEYFGEDPFLASETAVGYIKGVQSNDVIATVKHFCANNQEWQRHHISSDIDERTLQEIYLPVFKNAVRKGGVGAVMNSYNLLNGVHASENKWLNIDVLRDQWGFNGILMSDWTSVYSTVNAVNNGLDLEMPRGVFFTEKRLKDALENGRITEKAIDDKIINILSTAIAFGILDRPEGEKKGIIPLDNPESKKVALDCARDGIVLLKNKNSVLPLKKGKTLIMGEYADTIVSGGGSGRVNAFSIATPVSEMKKVKKDTKYLSKNELHKVVARGNGNNKITYTPDKDEIMRAKIGSTNGYRLLMNGDTLANQWGYHHYSHQILPLRLKKGKTYEFEIIYQDKKPKQSTYSLSVLNEDIFNKELAKANDVVIITGYEGMTEGENFDREFGLPPYEDFLINYAAERNPNVVVVLNAGGAIDVSAWEDKVNGIIMAWYPGQEGGTALAEILTGKLSPSGKLPISWDKNLKDSPTYGNYYSNRPKVRSSDTQEEGHVEYREGVFTGYRGYDKSGKTPQYPFGHGLGYSEFELSNPEVSSTFMTDANSGEETIAVSVDIKNKGKIQASETIQVYVNDPECSVPRPQKELKGFKKVVLNPGQTERVTIMLPKSSFEFYDMNQHDFRMEPGVFNILIGTSSQNLPLSKTITL